MPDSTIRKLLIRAPNWIGDAVMSEPALAAARRFAPQAAITLLAKPAVAELLTGHPDLDHFFVYEAGGRHAGLAGKWRLVRELRREGFDMAILLQNAFEAALLARLAGVPRRHGYATDARRWLLTGPVPTPAGAQGVHQTEYYLRLLQPLAGDAERRGPRLYLREEDRASAAACLRREGAGDGDVLIGINPGSTYGGAKRWLPERFAAAADAVVADLAAAGRAAVRAVLVGARGEEELAGAVAKEMTVPPISLVGKTGIRQLMAVIDRCRVFLTNDTGPMHVAAALGVPVVAVFGPTDPRATSPVGDRTALVRRPVDCAPCLLRECPIDHRCMTGISVDEVVEATRTLLKVGRLEGSKVGEVEGSQVGRLEGSKVGSVEGSKVQKLEGTTGGVECEQNLRTLTLDELSNVLSGVTVFLDRDGTLNRDTGYIGRPEDLELLPGAAEAVERLNRAGARVVLVSNQSGVGRGYFTAEDLARVHRCLEDLLARHGARLDGIYACPHHPEEGCACRKPGTGLVDRAAADLGVDPKRAYVVGDQWRDVELARRIGAKGILMGSAAGAPEDPGALADHVASGIADAVEWIIIREKKS